MENIQLFNTYLAKLERYCDYQERCLKEVEDKLISLDVPSKFHLKLIDALVVNKNFDNLRYAKAFASGKFRFKKWGRKKIFYSLKQKNISDRDIFNALLEIDEDEYFSALKELIEYKISVVGELNDASNKKKVLNYALQKGYESNLIWDIFKSI